MPGGAADIMFKPPGYPTISGVLLVFFKKQSPLNKFLYNQAMRPNYLSDDKSIIAQYIAKINSLYQVFSDFQNNALQYSSPTVIFCGYQKAFSRH